jgi:hypothetical protein
LAKVAQAVAGNNGTSRHRRSEAVTASAISYMKQSPAPDGQELSPIERPPPSREHRAAGSHRRAITIESGEVKTVGGDEILPGRGHVTAR